MKHFELNGQIRTSEGKAAIKALRKEGLVPCNLYGQGIENVLFTVSEKDLKGLTHTPASYIVDIKLSDGTAHTAVLHETQWHPVKENCLHADFLKVSEDKPVAIKVPINISGHAVGAQAGGKFVQSQRALRVSGLLKDLPDTLDVDITPLHIGERIVAGDIKLDGVTMLSPKDMIVCSVRQTRQSQAATAEAAKK